MRPKPSATPGSPPEIAPPSTPPRMAPTRARITRNYIERHVPLTADLGAADRRPSRPVEAQTAVASSGWPSVSDQRVQGPTITMPTTVSPPRAFAWYIRSSAPAIMASTVEGGNR